MINQQPPAPIRWSFKDLIVKRNPGPQDRPKESDQRPLSPIHVKTEDTYETGVSAADWLAAARRVDRTAVDADEASIGGVVNYYAEQINDGGHCSL